MPKIDARKLVQAAIDVRKNAYSPYFKVMVGAALLAGVATGVYSSLDDACGTVVSIRKSVQPSQSTAAVYNARFQTYQKLYQALEPLFGT